MTKTQLWVALFLGLFIVLFIIQRNTEQPAEKRMGPMGSMGAGAKQEEGTADGKTLTESFGCGSCHGADLKGTKMAPTLYGLESFYDRDKLINYLRNPYSFMDADRFKEYKNIYKNIVMPAYNNKDVKDLGKIADYLLGLR